MQNRIEIEDLRYPKLLKEIGKTAPKRLYYKGVWNEELFENCLAVVGSRRMTAYGRQVVERLVTQIASAGVTIVSGFMYGVDASAHEAAVNAGGKTIAVMPCGIDLVHPEDQVKLYDEILEAGGLVISEYEERMQPALWTYPQRNRIVAGLSKAVLVVEAAEKSGSLITANLAKKFKRKIFAVPGPVTSLVSRGTNDLIKNDEAEIVTEAGDILKFFGKIGAEPPNLQGAETTPLQQNCLEQQIISCLQNEAIEMDSLSRNLKKSIAELSSTISLMEIKGQIKNINGKYYVY
jgi:DNA processing protein